MLESKAGKILVIVYALASIGLYLAAFGCNGVACSVYLVVPTMPWSFIFVQDLGLPFPLALYPVFILLNASVAYVIGAGAEWLYHVWQDRRKGPVI